MSSLRQDLAAAITRAMAWQSWKLAVAGTDPEEIDFRYDPGEAYMLLVSFGCLPNERQMEGLVSLQGILQKISRLPAQGVRLNVHPYEPVRGAKHGDIALAVVIGAPSLRTPVILQQAFASFREELELDPQTDGPVFSEATPADVARAWWEVLEILKYNKLPYAEQDLVECVKLIRMLAERRLEFLYLRDELDHTSLVLNEVAPEIKEWKQLQQVPGYRQLPRFATNLSVRQVRALANWPADLHADELVRLLRKIYVDKLRGYRVLMAQIRERGRPEHVPYFMGQLMEAVVVSRLVGEQPLLWGGDAPSETVRPMEKTYPDEEPTDS